MTPTERKLFKESIIREYQLKYEKSQKKKNISHHLFGRLRKILPLNIAVGVVASGLLVYVNGWHMLGYLFLSGIIWMTIIATLVSTLLDPK